MDDETKREGVGEATSDIETRGEKISDEEVGNASESKVRDIPPNYKSTVERIEGSSG